MDIVEEAIEQDFQKNCIMNSILVGNNNIKIRMDDQNWGTTRIVNCVFRYNHTDERYGNVNVDLITTGL